MFSNWDARLRMTDELCKISLLRFTAPISLAATSPAAMRSNRPSVQLVCRSNISRICGRTSGPCCVHCSSNTSDKLSGRRIPSTSTTCLLDRAPAWTPRVGRRAVARRRPVVPALGRQAARHSDDGPDPAQHPPRRAALPRTCLSSLRWPPAAREHSAACRSRSVSPRYSMASTNPASTWYCQVSY